VVVIGAGLGVGTSVVDIWADGEDDREQELELFLDYSLQVHAIVVWLHAKAHTSIEEPHQCCFSDFDWLRC